MKQKQVLDQWGPIDAKILHMSFWFEPMINSGKTKWQATWPDVQGIFEKDRIFYVWNKKDMDIRGTWAIDNIILNNKVRKNLWQEYEQVINKAHKFVDKILKIKKQAKSNKDLYNSLSSYATEMYKLITGMWELGIIPELCNFASPNYLKEKLSSKISDDKIDRVLEILLTSANLSYHQQSELELLQATLKNGFVSHAAKWFWVENGFYESKILSVDDFKDKVKDLSKEDIQNKIIKIEKYYKRVNKRKKEIIEQYKLSSKIVKMADNLAHSIWWQDHRKGMSLWLNSALDIFNYSAAEELKIDFNEILYYRVKEWLNLFEDKEKRVSKKDLDERYNLSLFNVAVSKEKVIELHGKQAQKIIDNLGLDKGDDITNGELKGTSVSSGKVSGKARVLLSYRQANKMKQGEILVTPMTSPDYIIAMRKASAIITDVGGLMSHAAIISRELGVPCIVGTKVATKVLKNGDMIEVDANKGIIRKI